MGRSIPFLTITSISSIQLATTVDFSILLMTRYGQWRKKTAGKKEAMIKALSGGYGCNNNLRIESGCRHKAALRLLRM